MLINGTLRTQYFGSAENCIANAANVVTVTLFFQLSFRLRLLRVGHDEMEHSRVSLIQVLAVRRAERYERGDGEFQYGEGELKSFCGFRDGGRWCGKPTRRVRDTHSIAGQRLSGLANTRYSRQFKRESRQVSITAILSTCKSWPLDSKDSNVSA